MTRKDYELIASTIKGAIAVHGGNATAYAIIHNLSISLRSTNPAFDRERFIKACGGEI
jgi:hypothetical protein